MPNYLYKDSSELDELKRYGFKCWTSVKYEVGAGRNVESFDFNTTIIKGPISLYPYYEIEDVEKVATSIEYFTIKNGVIDLKEANLQGKITIPDPSDFGENVTASVIGDFTKGTGITHIFFKQNSVAYNKISSNAFSDLSSLISIKLPTSIVNIGDKAFMACKGLVSINFESLVNLNQIGTNAFSGCILLEINQLPDSITEIKPLAFLNCAKMKITNLPKKIETIDNYAFQATGVQISNFGYWDNSKLAIIGAGAFKSCTNSVRSMVLGASLTVIGNEAFSYYGNTEKFMVYDAHEMGYVYYNTDGKETTYSNMGFTVIPEPGYNDIWED